MSNRYDVIVIGGGIVGASIAYHLCTREQRSVLLLERGQLTCGTTWHAAGLVAELRASANLTQLARYSAQLYEQLEAEGFATGYRRVGAITLACSAPRQQELLRQRAMAREQGLVSDWLSRDVIAERWPHLATNDVLGGVYMPGDGQTNPIDTTNALAAAARQAGAVIRERCAVEQIVTQDGSVTGVDTADGHFTAPQVVLAAGLWSRELALAAGAHLPLHAAEHFYAVTEPLEIAGAPLIVRDPDHGTYFKPDAGRMLVGCFEREAKPIDAAELPGDFEFDELPFDLEHFAPYMEAAIERMPILGETGVRTWFNGPESFTPDGRYLLGPCPEVGGLFAACGFNSIGIQSAGGVGRVVAAWLASGRPPMDLWEVDTRRFQPLHNQPAFLRERCAESLGLLYAMHWPHRQYERARGQRRSPLHATLADAGACFGELNGWERPNWYARNGEAPSYRYAWGAQNWFANAAAEHAAVRTDVALFDQSSFAKYEVRGPQAEQLLNRLSTAEMNTEMGRVTYCQWLNERGGIEADVTITRLPADRFLVVSACASERRDLHWLAEHASGMDVEIRNLTNDLAVIGLMGPNAPEVLQAATGEDLRTFAFGTSRAVSIGNQQVRASRITYVGARGWELYMPNAAAMDVYRALQSVRAIPHAGYHAMDGLRIEKGYRHWGHDLTDEDTPLEAGVSFTIARSKGTRYLGGAAIEAQRQTGLRKRLISFRFSDAETHAFHDEPIWRNGRPVGRVTSAAYGHTIGACIAHGYVHGDFVARREEAVSGRYQIEVEDKLIDVTASLRPWHDPTNTEVR